MTGSTSSTPFGKVGKEQTDAMVNLQKEFSTPMSRPTAPGLRA